MKIKDIKVNDIIQVTLSWRNEKPFVTKALKKGIEIDSVEIEMLFTEPIVIWLETHEISSATKQQRFTYYMNGGPYEEKDA